MKNRLNDWISRARRNRHFAAISERFNRAGIKNWLLEDEKPLLFAIGRYAPGKGVVVEIGSFEGGSASFLAAGIKARGKGRLYCVDPHLGGPPWLGMAPHQSTLEIFLEKMRYCGVNEWVSPKIGDSTAVAAIWPAEPIDALFIDGDHSFRGALKDLESWLPKLRAGGHLLVDDADDPVLVELLDFIDFVKKLKCVEYIGTVQGMAVFERRPGSSWEALQELSQACSNRGISRPWNYASLHTRTLPKNYLRSRSWPPEHALEIAYQLCFLARCGPGPYGYTSNTRPEDREVLYSLSRDRQDGDVVDVGEASASSKLRALFCSIDEAADLAPRLMTGGVLITRERQADSIGTRSILIQAGLDGCGFENGVHWGVWQPSYLSPDAVIEYAMQAYQSPEVHGMECQTP